MEKINILIFITIFLSCFTITINLKTSDFNLTNLPMIKDYPSDHPCEEKIRIFFDYFYEKKLNITIPDERLKELEFSGKNINDLGDYYGCKLMKNSSDFVLVSIRAQLRGFIQIGLCLPKECKIEYILSTKNNFVQEINKLLNANYTSSSIEVLNSTQSIYEQVEKNYLPGVLIFSFILLIFLFSLLSYILVGNASSMSEHGLLEKKKSNKVSFIFQSFDIKTNLMKIFTVNRDNMEIQELSIFDGVRTFSNYSVIIAHTFSFLLFFPIRNAIDVIDITQTFYYSLIICCFYSVDMFFYMSGFFIYFSLSKDKRTKFSTIIFYRLIRLMPLYVIVILASTYCLPFFLNGPSINSAINYTSPCKQYWWHNILFINNLIWYEDNNCLGHTWYLANDFQFFIFFVVIWFFLMRKSKKLGNLILLIAFIVSIVVNFIVVYYYDIYLVNAKQILLGEDSSKNDFFYIYYVKPWNRIGVYILGIFFSQLYLARSNDDTLEIREENIFTKFNNKLKNSNLFALSVLIFAVLFIAGPIFLMHPYTKYALDWSRTCNALFVTFGKIFFVLGSALILHLTFFDRLSIVKTIFSFKIFTSISRVSYAIYLIHAYVILVLFTNYPTAVCFSPFDMTIMSLGFYVISAVISLPASLLFDSPIMGLLKGLLRKTK
jgi:peptidoglycan/LPS O-acetylase OafA/YrhL